MVENNFQVYFTHSFIQSFNHTFFWVWYTSDTVLEAQDKMMKNSTQPLAPSSNFYTLVYITIIAESVKNEDFWASSPEILFSLPEI